MTRHPAGLTGNGQQCFSGDCSSGNCTLVSHAEENVEVSPRPRHPATSQAARIIVILPCCRYPSTPTISTSSSPRMSSR